MIGVGLVGYFAYHAVQGDRGLLAWIALDNEVAEARAIHAELTDERRVLEARVNGLRDGSLDVDLLAERARVMLNYAHPDDVIIVEQR
jgi:cell division protein FtsB